MYFYKISLFRYIYIYTIYINKKKKNLNKTKKRIFDLIYRN